MKTSNGRDGMWPLWKRLLHQTLGWFAHVVTQVIGLALESVAWILRRENMLAEQRAVRKAARLSWIAETLDRNGKTAAALQTAKDAFAALMEADPRATVLHYGVGLAGQLDHLAQKAGDPQAVRAELGEVLRILTEIQRQTARQSVAFARTIAWLEYRLEQSR